MNRRRSQALAVLSLLIALAACSDDAPLPTRVRPAQLEASRSGSGGGTTNVTSTVAGSPGDPTSTYQIRSDGAGAYTNSATMTSNISSTGEWLLDSYFPRNSTRTIYLDFSRPIAGSGPNGGPAVSIPTGTYRFQGFVNCPDSFYNNSFLTIAPGQTVNCPLHIGELYVGSELYSINMNPFTGAEGFAWTETNWTNVTCVSTTAPCTHWTITPTATAPDGSSANVTVLLHHVTTTTKGKTTTTPVKQGDFYMTFRIDVTRP